MVGEARHKKLSQGLPRNEPSGRVVSGLGVSLNLLPPGHYPDAPECKGSTGTNHK